MVAAARVVLQDWNEGRIRFYTTPPERQSGVAGADEVVTQWGAEFDADAVFGSEGARAVVQGLPSLDGGGEGGTDVDGFVEMTTQGPVELDLEAMGAEEEEEGASDDDDEEEEEEGEEMDEEDGPLAGAPGAGR